MKLKDDLENAVNKIIKAFEKKQGLNFEFFVCDDVTGVACFGCVYYFNIQDICHDIFTEQPKEQIIDWLHDSMGNEKQYINYQSYCKGARYNNGTDTVAASD